SGGPPVAAGLSMPEPALPRFTGEFERVAREWIEPSALRQTLETDGELNAEELTLGFAQDIAARVWGQGFAAPVFDGEFDVVEQRQVGDRHIRLALMASGRRVDAIVFNESGPLAAQIRAAYRPEVSEYQGLVSLQLVVERWAPRALKNAVL